MLIAVVFPLTIKLFSMVISPVLWSTIKAGVDKSVPLDIT